MRVGGSGGSGMLDSQRPSTTLATMADQQGLKESVPIEKACLPPFLAGAYIPSSLKDGFKLAM